MADAPDKKAMALAKLIENVADAGGPLEAVKVVDDRAYRRGVKDGKRAQRTADLPFLLAVSGIAVLAGQIPHLLLFLHRKSEEKKARERKELAEIERIRLELEKNMKQTGRTASGS